MAYVLIIGASKGIGLETTRLALEGGHKVRALARSAAGRRLSDPNLEEIQGDALDRRDIEAALDGMDAVIQTLGVSSLGDLLRPVHLFSDATRILLGAMEAKVAKRLICVTGFCDDACQCSVRSGDCMRSGHVGRNVGGRSLDGARRCPRSR